MHWYQHLLDRERLQKSSLTENVGFGFTDACKNITVQDTDVINGKQQNLFVESKNVCELKGNISGFDTDYDTSALRILVM